MGEVALAWTTIETFRRNAGRALPMPCDVCGKSVLEYLTACGERDDHSVDAGICADCLATVGVVRVAELAELRRVRDVVAAWKSAVDAATCCGMSICSSECKRCRAVCDAEIDLQRVADQLANREDGT